MSRGGKRSGAGNKPLEEKYGEAIRKIEVRLTESQIAYIDSQSNNRNQFIRDLIERDRQPPP